MDRIIYKSPLMSNEVFYMCDTHGIPYPKGAKCPACEGTVMSDHKKLVERLERIFPTLEMYSQPELFNNEEDCSPGCDVSWHDIIEKLKMNGLKIGAIND